MHRDLALLAQGEQTDEGPPPSAMLVQLSMDVAGVRTLAGDLLSAEQLGYGLVQTARGGQLYVHWVGADTAAWVDASDVVPCGANRRLLTVQRRDRAGRSSLVGYFLGTLEAHWTVELLPREVIRAVRADGHAWTFRYNALMGEIQEPPFALSDEAADALTAADQAIAHVHPPPSAFLGRTFGWVWAWSQRRSHHAA